jgi:hypothetical protein
LRIDAEFASAANSLGFGFAASTSKTSGFPGIDRLVDLKSRLSANLP